MKGQQESASITNNMISMLKAVDRFEDQVEDRAFNELLPLHIKLALEDRVFGWSHVSSTILGHVVITVGAYYATYFCLGFLPFELYILCHASVAHSIRVFVSLTAALLAFRFVRRRRRVWLPAPYGSKDYRDDKQRRRREVAETDFSTLLGHMRRRREVYLHGRVQKTLSEAEVVFTSFLQSERKTHPSFQTFPTDKTRSVDNDQVTFGPIQTMPYSHGGFFGAAPFLLANPDWITIMRNLMPDVYVEISRRVLKAPAHRLMHWAENNPVVAAYGTANLLENTGRIVKLEWDVFLDPRLVRRVERVLEQLVNFKASSSKHDSDEKDKILKVLNEELDRRSSQLVDKMLIAHGNLNQLLLEQTGFAKDYNYSRVKRTRRTLGGGMYARQWMAVYAEALRLGMTMGERFGKSGQIEPASENEATRPTETCPLLVATKERYPCDDKKPSETSALLDPATKLVPKSTTNVGSTCLSSLSSTSCPNTSIRESVELLRQVTNESKPIGLVLDLKSRHIPKHIWAIVVNKLNIAGARVEAVASFTVDEIRDIGRLCREPLQEIIFCHSAGDLQQACHDGRLMEGDSVFVNGGSLLWEAPSSVNLQKLFHDEFDPAQAMKGYRLLPFCSNAEGSNNTLMAYKNKLNLKIGLYVQEFGIDEAALTNLVNFTNEHANLLEHGLSWGGINGVTVKGIRPGRFTSTDGFHTQRYAGRSWDFSRSAEDVVVEARVMVVASAA